MAYAYLAAGRAMKSLFGRIAKASPRIRLRPADAGGCFKHRHEHGAVRTDIETAGVACSGRLSEDDLILTENSKPCGAQMRRRDIYRKHGSDAQPSKTSPGKPRLRPGSSYTVPVTALYEMLWSTERGRRAAMCSASPLMPRFEANATAILVSASASARDSNDRISAT